MRLLPHEPSSRREKANQDPAEQQRRKLLMPGGVGGVVLGTSFLPRGTADPPLVTSGENTELGSSSHPPGQRNGPSQEGRGHPSACCSQENKPQLLGVLLGLSSLHILQELLSQELAPFPLNPAAGVLDTAACKKHSLF